MGKKKKLTKGQLRRVKANQAKRLDKESAELEINSDALGPRESGRVMSRYGQHADVIDNEGNVLRCNLRRNIESLVTGDIVVWRRFTESEQGMQGVIEAVEERQSELLRPDIYDGLKPVAANVDRIFIVSSPQPAFSDQIIDRYLVACEEAGIQAVIVFNKSDLITDEEREHIDNRLAVYRKIGYPVYVVSAKQKTGMEELRQAFSDHISVFVGQSGVGKSSLMNALLPEVDLQVGAISENSGLGQHTTTVARWHDLEGGGALIDSPGIREFGLWHLPIDQIAQGFVDFHPYLGTCKFRDCKHGTDPGCSLQEAVANGELDEGRLANYHRIVESISNM